MVRADTVLIRDGEPAGVLLDDNYVLLSVRAGSYFEFNRIATEIWKILAEPCRVSEVLDRLSKTHDVDTQILSRDVTSFLNKLVKHRLVRVVQ